MIFNIRPFPVAGNIWMHRRKFMSLIAGTTCWSLGASAQQVKRPIVGQLWHAASAEEEGKYLVAMERGFSDLGYVSGQNIAFEYRFPAEKYDRFNELAAGLAQMKVDVIVAVTGPAALAAKRATDTIPIVFALVADPVASKLVDSLAKPGGNVTGLSNVATDLSAKRLEVFKEATGGITRIALLLNPRDPDLARRTLEDTKNAAELSGLQLTPIEVTAPSELERAFTEASAKNLQGVVLPFDGMLFNARQQIADLALRYRLPTIHPNRDAVDAGLLMSYGPDHEAILRRAPYYVDKILKGTHPRELPVEQPVRFVLVINLKTARLLNLTISPSVLARADQVIE